MHEAANRLRALAEQPRNLWIAAGSVLAGICFVVLPAIPILLGVFLIVAALVHACIPEMRPYTTALLRIPVSTPGRIRTHLAIAAATGVTLVAVGSVGATMRGKMLTRWEQGSERFEDARVHETLARARESLAASDVDQAEYFLLSIDLAEAEEAGKRDEVEELLNRLRRSSDHEVILDILEDLTDEELVALESRTTIPEELDFGDRALTFRAANVAITLLGEARSRRE